ncbi:MAG: hypothetical protein FJZ78_08600 [Bacteroidetes bacterium]|nr:hypothetical protein [Bacteroidota bacterium]
MNKLVLTLICLPVFAIVAQTVKPEVASRSIKNANADGFQVEITGPIEQVRPSFERFLRESGKLKISDGLITVTNPVIGGSEFPKYAIYGSAAPAEKQAEGQPLKSVVWIGKIAAEWSGVDSLSLTAGIKDLAHRFGIKFYRDQIQLQIDETQKAIDATERRLQKLSAENRDFNEKLVSNEQDKIRLEKALQQNAVDHETLLRKIDMNKKAQDSVTNASAQIRKVLDAQKEKQLKVN